MADTERKGIKLQIEAEDETLPPADTELIQAGEPKVVFQAGIIEVTEIELQIETPYDSEELFRADGVKLTKKILKTKIKTSKLEDGDEPTT